MQVEARPQEHTAGQHRLHWWLFVTAVLGTLEVAQFLASNSGMFTSAPGRAAGSALGLLLWLALTGLAGFAAISRRSAGLGRPMVVLSGLLALGSVGLAAIHAAAHVGGLRPALGGLLGLAVLLLAIVAQRA